MAQFTEMSISEKTANPVTTIHGERDQFEQQPWPRPLAPAAIHTTATEMSDDQHHGENEDDHPHKKSVLQKVKEKAKKLIKKKKKKQPDHGHEDEHREEEVRHHFDDDEDEEEGEEEDTDEEEEVKARDLNPSDFYSRPLDNASAVSPELNAFSARTLLNGTQLARDTEAPEAQKTEVQWTSRDPNILAGVASDYRATSLVETARRQQDVPAAPVDNASAVSPELTAFSARTLLNDTQLARDPEAPETPKTEVQWTSGHPNMLAGAACDHRATSLAETARRQQDVRAAPVDNASAVSPELNAFSARTLLNDTQLARDPEAPKTEVQWTSGHPNMLAGAASDHRATSLVEAARRQPDVPAAPVDNASAVSPELNAFSARTLLKDTQLARDPEAPEAPKTEVQWTSRDPNMLAGAASDHRATSLAETARRQQDVPAAPGQSSAGIAPILQSKEAAYGITARNPDYDVQKSDDYMTHQVQELGTTGKEAPDLTLQTEFHALPNYSRGKEAQENVLNKQDETDRIEYSDTFVKSPPLPAGMMKSAIIEEPVMGKLIERASEVCGFDSSKGNMAADVGSGDSTVKDQNPSSTIGDTEESGSNEFKYAENKLEVEGTDINRHYNVSDEPQDLRVEDAYIERFNENTGRSAALEAASSVVGTAIGMAQGLKDRIEMGLGGTVSDSPANENDKEIDNEGTGHDRSYTEKIAGVTLTAKNAIASKLGYGEHHEPADELPNKTIQTSAEEDNYENNGEGKSYRGKIYDTASAAKNVISSKLGYGEHEVPVQEDAERKTDGLSAPVQEDAEKKTDGLSADHDDEAQEEGDKSLTDKIYETASAANSVVSSKLGYEKQEDPLVEEKPEEKTMETYEDEHDIGEGKSYTQKIYETAITAKNAISSKIGYGGKESDVQHHEQQIDKVSKVESNAYPVSYSN